MEKRRLELKTVVGWFPAACIPAIWLVLYWWFIASRSSSQPLLLWGVGALIVWQIVIFVSGAPGPIPAPPPPRDEYWPPYPVCVAIIAALILILGMIAGWLATTPGLVRAIAAVLIGLENLFVYSNREEWFPAYLEGWSEPPRSSHVFRVVEVAFVPIILLGLVGVVELSGHITRLAGCL